MFYTTKEFSKEVFLANCGFCLSDYKSKEIIQKVHIIIAIQNPDSCHWALCATGIIRYQLPINN